MNEPSTKQPPMTLRKKAQLYLLSGLLFALAFSLVFAVAELSLRFYNLSGVTESRDHVTSEGYVELGKLKGNIGNQNYPIPEGVDPTKFNAVVIYCKPFHVLFSVAKLR